MSVESGELRLNVVADTSGLGADLKAKLARIKESVTVQAKVNTTQLRAELARAAKNITVTVTPKVNATELRAALAAATKNVTVTVTPKINVTAMRAALAAATREVKVDARVDFDRAQVQASFAAATAGLRFTPTVDIDRNKLFQDVRRSIILAMSNLPPIPIPTPGPGGGGGGGGPSPIPAIRDSAGSLVGTLAQIGKVATIAVAALALFEGAGSAILGVVGALTAVVNGLFAITAASGAAVGALAAIPVALSGLVGIVGTVLAGFKGVGGAIQGLQETQQNAGKTAQQLAKAQQSGARAVEAAQKRVRAAYEGVETAAYSLAQAQRAVRDATERVAQSQRASRDAVENLTDAQENLADAQQNVVQVQRDQARAVATAEANVARAFKSTQSAREALNNAYKDAADALDDYQSKLANAAFDEEGALLSLERARERLNDVNTDPSAKILDRKEADLAFREAQQRLKDIQKSNRELQQEASDAAKKGIAGSDVVKNAQEQAASAAEGLADAQEAQAKAVSDRAAAEQAAAEQVVDAQKAVRGAYEGVEDAQRGVRDAIEGVQDAQRGLVQAQKGQVKAAEEVTDSQRDLIQAQKDAAESIKNASGALTASQQAFLKASPAAQDFARFIVAEVIPALQGMQTAVQNILLPKLTTALRNLIPVAKPFTTALEAMATALGDGAIAASELFSSPAWQRDIVTSGENNARTVGRLFDSLLDLLDVFRNISIAAQPMIDRFTAYFGAVTDGWKATAELNRENGKLADYFQRTGDVISQWGRIIGNIVDGIGNIGDAATPAGQELLNAFEGTTENFVRWTQENSGMIGAYFDAIVPTVKSVARILVNVLSSLGRISSNPATLRITELIEKRLGPALDRLITALLDSGSGEIFVELMSDLLDILTAIVKSEGLKDVLGFLEGVASAIAKFGDTEQGRKVFHDLILVAAIGGPLALVASGALKLYGALARIFKLPAAGSLLAKLPGLVKGAAKALGKGGLIGVGAGLAGAAVGGVVSDGEGGARDVVGGALSGAGTGAAIGATLGSVIPGLGTGVGAAVGAGVGGIAGAVNANGGIKKTFEDIKGAMAAGFAGLNSFAESQGVNLGNLIKNPLQELPNVVSAIAEGIPNLLRTIGGFGEKAFAWIGDQAYAAARGAVNFIANIPSLAITGLTAAVRAAPAIFDWLLDAAESIVKAVAGYIGDFFRDPLGTIKNTGEFLANLGSALFGNAQIILEGALGIGIKIWEGIRDGFGDVGKRLGPQLAELLAAIVDSAVKIGARWNEFWTGIARFVGEKFLDIVNAVVQFGVDVYNKINDKFNAIKKFWSDLWDYIKTWAVNRIIEFVTGAFDRFNTFRNNLQEVFNGITKAWDSFWTGLRELAAKPINFVIDTVINGGIGGAWKAVDKFLNGILPDWKDVPRVQFADGGVMPGYTPGRDVHWFSSPTGGTLGLSGGEAIMRPEWTRAVGGPKAVEAMNRAARSGSAAFASGGVWGPVQRFASGGVAAVISFGKWLRTQGYDVSENKALGDNPRPGVHSSRGYHYRDDNSGAIDVNAGAGTSLAEQIKLAKAVNSARTRGLRSYFFASDGSHQDHAHFDYGSGDNVQTGRMPKAVRDALTTSAGDGSSGFFSGLWDDIKGQAGNAAAALVKAASNLPIVSTIMDMGKALGSSDDVSLGSVGVGAARSLVDSVKNFLSDKVGGFLGSGESAETAIGGLGDYIPDITSSDNLSGASSASGKYGRTVERWRNMAIRALQLTGSPVAWIDSLLRRMKQESGGDPRAINNSDINARRGTPSKGLMQVIDPTFRANALAPYDRDVYDPLSNIIASIRYANKRYGNAPRGWDRKGGYSLGGVIDIPSLGAGATILPKSGGTLALLAERGKSETVVDTGKLNARLDDLEGVARLVASAPRGTIFEEGAFQISIVNPAPEPASKSVADRLRTVAAFGLFDQS